MYTVPSNGTVTLVLEPFICDQPSGCPGVKDVTIYKAFATETINTFAGLSFRIGQPYVNA
jgi:hypothetical protein